VTVINSTTHGMNERSIVNGGWGVVVRPDTPRLPRERGTVQMIKRGMREKSIVEVQGRHYQLVHPTEKPVRLAERIIALISEPGDIIYDPFMGSGSIGVACVNIGRKYIGSEIIPEYFKTACTRIEMAYRQAVLSEAGNG
jgi:site-specific DNA-methyltransferase (adenine-specific)